MKSMNKVLLKFAGMISCLIFFVLFMFNDLSSFGEVLDLISQSAGYGTFVIIVYERWLWKLNPCLKIPRFKKEYKGILKYEFKDQKREKTIDVRVIQTLTEIQVLLKSDEVHSKSVTSELVYENGQYVVYYTYITEPKAEFSEKNPIQNGTCKLIIDNVKEFRGIYWTNRKTIGDIYFYEKK